VDRPSPVKTTANPLQVGTLPLNQQYQPDLVPQKYAGGTVPTIRCMPVAPSGVAASNAGAQSVSEQVVNETITNTTLESLTDVQVFNRQPGQTIVWNGSAWVNATASLSLSTPGYGYFTGPGFVPPFPFYGSSLGSGVVDIGTANRLNCWQFVLNFSITVSRVTILVETGVAGQTVNMGIYSAQGAKLIDSGALAAASSSSNSSNTITPVTLPAGVYWFAQSTSHAAVHLGIINGVTSQFTDMLNLNGTYVGYAANSTVSGVMPSALGTITASDLSATNPTAAVFQV
jgi:hypothetical protein